uniref:Uncharacterized protein n=1 Tax=viral metagenome TaxID=1070528 RepID=A0A6C0CHC5_9ZZZZ
MLFVAWVYDQVFHCCRRVEKLLFKEEDENVIPLSKLPWLWLGFVDDEGNILDYTNIIKIVNIPNVHVTSTFLTNVADLDVIGKWQYMDQTLQIQDFPSEGFVINYVADEPANQEKTD